MCMYMCMCVTLNLEPVEVYAIKCVPPSSLGPPLAVCGAMLQRISVCCSVWQHVAVCGSAWQRVAAYVLQRVAACGCV